MLESAKSGKMRAGKNQLIKYLKGDRLTRGQAIKAKCYDCNGMGDSGECDIDTCSLFPYSQFSRERKKAIKKARGSASQGETK